MKALLGLGKWMLIIPIFVFGIFHFMNADKMAGMAPGEEITVYITGVCLLLAAISMAIGKYDKLAAFLLGILLLLFMIPHIQMLSDDPNQMSQILKNIVMASAAWLYASGFASDNSVIG